MHRGSSCNPADTLGHEGIHLRDLHQAVDVEVLAEHRIGKAARRAVVHALDLTVREALTEATGEVAKSGTCFRHRHRWWDAEVDEEVGPMWCAGNAPGEATADRADVNDPLLPSIRRSLLPFRCELQHRVEHVTHSYDRILVPSTFAERGVDEWPAGRDPHPDRAIVAQDDLLLGRLAQDAHVGHCAVRREEA